MKKIYALGNSLTQDTTRWLRDIALEAGEDFKIVNLLASGQTIEGHLNSFYRAEKGYDLIINGQGTRLRASIQETFFSDKWDYIIFQQAYDSYEVTEAVKHGYRVFADFFRTNAPEAKLLLLNTWSFPKFENYHEMVGVIEEQAKIGAELLGIGEDNIVPVGKVICEAHESGIQNIYRDEVHASLSVGRYLAGQTLYSYLTGKNAINGTFRTFTAPQTEEDHLYASLHGTPFAPTDEAELLLGQKIINKTLGL
jgi:hypothetical protein